MQGAAAHPAMPLTTRTAAALTATGLGPPVQEQDLQAAWGRFKASPSQYTRWLQASGEASQTGDCVIGDASLLTARMPGAAPRYRSREPPVAGRPGLSRWEFVRCNEGAFVARAALPSHALMAAYPEPPVA